MPLLEKERIHAPMKKFYILLDMHLPMKEVTSTTSISHEGKCASYLFNDAKKVGFS
jgi:hypothetical protein